MTDPSRRFIEVANAMHRSHDVFLHSQRAMEQLARSSALLAAGRNGFFDSMVDLQRRLELADPMQKINRIMNQMQSAQLMADQLGQRFKGAMLTIDQQASKWHSVIEPAISRLEQMQRATTQFSSLADSLVAWESTTSQLSNRLAEIGLLADRIQLSARLFAPSRAFTTFAHHTVERIESAQTDQVARALEISLQLAEEQLIATSETMELVVDIPTDADEVSEPRELLAPYIQQDELNESASSVADIDTFALLDSSKATKSIDISRVILSTIASCNEARKVAGVDEIFKPTTKLLEVYADLPWLMPTNKHTFSQFVDCLYFLFYEGAGKDNLRFMKSNGGPIPDDEFDFILCIKHLRNKWTRHDADHGKDAAIRKAWAELAVKFQMLGMPHMPVTESDFRLLHFNLLTMANEFVSKILRGVVGSK